jgi:putative pyruvate formate lyase activating enzyme
MSRRPQDPLRRYTSILKGEARPSFQEAKRSPTDIEGVSVLGRKVRLADALSSECQLCEHRCRTLREKGRSGKCGVLESRITAHFPHYGEERPLVPSYTVFFAGCNLRCLYCQNWDISTDPDAGEIIPPFKLARLIEARGLTPLGAAACQGIRNVNWVGGDPIPHLPYVLRVLRDLDLDVPQVWNSNMYMTEEALNVLEGTMDVFLTDLKYGNNRCAVQLSSAPRYWEVVTRNHCQAARQGEMIIRHLMLPGHMECCTVPILEWIAENLPQVAVNIMDQYRPEHRAKSFPGLDRGIRPAEHRIALERAERLGLNLI